jgi:hypothetical protein
MAGLTRIAFPAALLALVPGAVLAQDEGAQPQTMEQLPGVPAEFSLPPGTDPAPPNRMEPMVQPLPQPSAAPAIAASPMLEAIPQATPSPQPTAIVQSERREVAAAPARRSVEPPAAEQGMAQPASENVVPQVEQAPEVPSVAAKEAPQEEVSEQAPSGWDRLAWVLGGLLLAVLAAMGAWWLRSRAETRLVVEKIEPYRLPTPSQGKDQQSGLDPGPAPEGSAKSASGLVHAKGPAPVANAGGFVTSTIATRLLQQKPRHHMSSDGRIVTSLSRDRD